MNVAGLKGVSSTESDPETPHPLLVLVACPVDNRPAGAPRLSGQLKIKLSPDSLAYRVYRRQEIEERFTCNYELNEAYGGELEAAGIKVSGVTPDGGARIVELPGHRFYIGTGFVPQLLSGPGCSHPLITAFLEAAL